MSYTISTWQSSDVGERRPTLKEHPQFRRGFVFCRDCFVFRVCYEIMWGSSLFVSVLKTLGSWPFSSDFLELNRWYLKQNWWSLKTLKVISQTQIPTKDINSSNLKFWTCISFHLFKILYLEMISNKFSYIFKQLVPIWIPFNRILADENM